MIATQRKPAGADESDIHAALFHLHTARNHLRETQANNAKTNVARAIKSTESALQLARTQVRA